MAEKVVSQNGLLYFFQKLKEIFVRKEDGKGLSSNDFTTEEKLKLMNIEAGANKTVVTDSLTNTSTENALSANSGKVLNDKIESISDNIGNLVGGEFAPKTHTHTQSEVIGLEAAIGTMTEIARGKCRAEVFDTVDELDTWLSDSANTADLNTGDVFYIRAVDVPDYWWDKEQGKKQILETTKVTLDFVTHAEIDAIVAS